MADLYFVLSAFCLPQIKADSLVQCFESAFQRASDIDWPDLAKEMGLTILNAEKIAEAIKLPEKDDKVCVIKCSKNSRNCFAIINYDLLRKKQLVCLFLNPLYFHFFCISFYSCFYFM